MVFHSEHTNIKKKEKKETIFTFQKYKETASNTLNLTQF